MKLPKNLLTVSAFALTLGASSVAAAQTCPPGSWFCADAQVQGSATVNVGGGGLQPLPPPVAGPPPVVVVQPGAPPPAPAPLPPPVVVYQPAPPPVVVVQPRPAEYTPVYARRYAMPYAQHEWGFNLRLDMAAMGGSRNGGGGMGGLGAGLRYKLSPYFGVEGGADFVFGKDYNGNNRNETAFTVDGLLFLNPKSRTQVYLLGGLGWSVAHVSDDNLYGTSTFDDTYHYFGGNFGLGFEYRASRAIAFNVDVRGFVRGRTDNDAKVNPEFRDPATGRTTNTSGGALVTAGMTFYF
jgi:hypothetical protein